MSTIDSIYSVDEYNTLNYKKPDLLIAYISKYKKRFDKEILNTRLQINEYVNEHIKDIENSIKGSE